MKKLHLGCGTKILKDFINVDIRDDVGADVIDDIFCLEGMSAESVDLIYVCHVFEHVQRFKILSVLERWYNLLRSGGILRLAVPDFEKVSLLYNRGVSLSKLIGFLYGGQDYAYNFHYYCWDLVTLSKTLSDVGFSQIKPYEWRDTEHADIDDYSQCYYPHMDKQNGLLMSLNVECTK